MENYHIAEAFKLINFNTNCNIFSDLSTNDTKIIRKRIIEMVLATDMTMHNKELVFIKTKLEIIRSTPTENPNGSMISNYLDNVNDKNLITMQQDFLNILIHTADISNPTKSLNLYKKWTDLIINEFWQQGDKEKKMSLPVSFACDRIGASVPKIQIGFIEGIVLPLFSCVAELFPNLEYMKINLSDNNNYNKDLLEKEKKFEENK